jgi:hypothetical protein
MTNITEFPRDIRQHILNFIEAPPAIAAPNGNLSYRAVCRIFKDDFDDRPQLWNQLKAKAPESSMNIPKLMGKIEEQYPDTKSYFLFKELSKHFVRAGVSIPVGHLPMNEVHFQKLQDDLKKYDETLLFIWSKAKDEIELEDVPEGVLSEIRDWIDAPTHSPLLDKVVSLDIFYSRGVSFKALCPEIGNFKKLEQLSLFQNELEELPDTLMNLANLKTLNLGFNKFKIFPECIKTLVNLEILNFYKNELEVVPDFIGNLAKLQTLFLSQNKLKTLPPTITNLSKLTSFKINGNPLESIPEKIVNSNVDCIRENQTVKEFKEATVTVASLK